MFVVQFDQSAWVGQDGRLTTSGAHALRVADAATAQVRLEQAVANRCGITCHLPPRQRAHYAAPTCPVTVLPAAELDARLAVNAAHGNTGRTAAPAADGPTPAGDRAEPRAPRQGGGVTRQVYQWVLDNPQATRADALAAFPSANPSTVGVQFGAARRASKA